MTNERNDQAWLVESARDFTGLWRCFDDTSGPCPNKIKKGRIDIRSSLVEPNLKAAVVFEGVEGFPNAPFEGDLKGDTLELTVDGTRFRIRPCGFNSGRRVIHGENVDTRPGSWTAEEEDGKPPEDDPPTY
ncbi:MAG: hypothetical protein AAF560_27495 [Acidobacteriota bacterium]